VERCLVLSARRYSFDDAAGKHVEGAMLTYLTGVPEREADRRGCEPMTAPVPGEVYSELGALPAVCDLEFRQRPGPKGRPTLTITSVGRVQPVDLLAAMNGA
jgi:hypothetical protein